MNEKTQYDADSKCAESDTLDELTEHSHHYLAVMILYMRRKLSQQELDIKVEQNKVSGLTKLVSQLKEKYGVIGND